VASPEIVSDSWMIIGRQEDTGFGGRIDLLAIEPDGTLVLIELKRGRTPREVVAQAIDYATWLEGLDAQKVGGVYARFAPGHDLVTDFRTRFGQVLDEDTVNQDHQIVIVAASLDASSERIVAYLNKRDIRINVLCFQVFDTGSEQLLSRAWLLDPVETQVAATTAGPASLKEPWNGEYYVNFDDGVTRSWPDAVKYGFVSAGGGSWYSNTLKLLQPGNRIWVNAPGHGFVGVGRVNGPRQPAPDFTITIDDRSEPALDVLASATYHRQFVTDPEKMEYFVSVEWAETVPLDKAVNEIGLFGNQNTVCAPKIAKWRHTIDRLKEAFPRHDGHGSGLAGLGSLD
jgi:hypothetical protein